MIGVNIGGAAAAVAGGNGIASITLPRRKST